MLVTNDICEKMNCKACDKQFTGIVSYNQHIVSEKHKKKMMIHSQNSGTPNESLSMPSQASSEPQARNINTFPCEVCSKIFYSLSDFMQHCSSEEHAKSVLNKSSQISTAEKKIPVSSTATNGLSINEPGIDHVDSISQMNKDSGLLCTPGSVNPNYSRCELCDKNFSGLGNYEQHIVSKGHIKKCALQSSNALQKEIQNIAEDISSNASDKTFNNSLSLQQHESVDHARTMLSESNSDKVNSNKNSCVSLNSLICETCNMTFTGPVPHNQHLESNVHKRNVGRKQLVIRMNELEGKENRPKVAINSCPWYCEVCNKICSGPEPYREHLNSNNHKKNVAKAGAESKQNEIRNIMSQSHDEVDIFSNQKSTTADFNLMQDNNSASGVSKTSEQDANDSFLSANSTLTVDLANLNNMTFFKVGEEIDFDREEKCGINISEMDNDEVDDIEDGEEETSYEDMPSP